MRPTRTSGWARRCAPQSGRIFAGANVENASYPEGNCAEASAIAAMVAAGERQITEALVVAAGERLCTPCGGCRQRLAEFAGPELPIHLCDPQGLRRTVTLGELLPLSLRARRRAERWVLGPSREDAPSERATEHVARHGASGGRDATTPATAVDVIRARAAPAARRGSD